MTEAPLLAIRDLYVVYQRAIGALHGIDLDVHRGTIVGVLGNNGAGKSTTLRAISGFIGLDNARIAKGSIQFKDRPIERLPPHRIADLGIALVPEREKVFANLTIAENLAVVHSKAGRHERRRLESAVFEYFPRLASMRHKEAGLLSGGERQMLAVGAALVCGPELLMIDELSLGLASSTLNDLAERLVCIQRDMNLTMLIVEQNASIVLRIAQHVYVLENGRSVLHGTPDTLRGNRNIQESYLGTSGNQRVNYREAVMARRRNEAL